jgi:hypothetical protein
MASPAARRDLIPAPSGVLGLFSEIPLREEEEEGGGRVYTPSPVCECRGVIGGTIRGWHSDPACAELRSQGAVLCVTNSPIRSFRERGG